MYHWLDDCMHLKYHKVTSRSMSLLKVASVSKNTKKIKNWIVAMEDGGVDRTVIDSLFTSTTIYRWLMTACNIHDLTGEGGFAFEIYVWEYLDKSDLRYIVPNLHDCNPKCAFLIPRLAHSNQKIRQVWLLLPKLIKPLSKLSLKY